MASIGVMPGDDQDDKTCLYRGDGGLMCAMGCFLPDRFYRKDMEGRDVEGILSTYRNRKGEKKYWRLVDEHEYLLNELQGIHDSFDDESLTRDEVRRGLLVRFQILATQEGLEFDSQDYTVKRGQV